MYALLQAKLSEEKMKNIIVISKREFDELKLLIDDLKRYIEIIEPKIPSKNDNLSEHFSPYLTEVELSQLF